MQLNGARVLVTGATGGLGAAIAEACAARGATVIVSGRRADAVQEIAARIGARPVVADLAVDGAVEKLLDEAGEVDVVVANAALPGSGELFDYTVEQIDRAVAVNLRAPMLLARLAGEQMQTRGRGHLVFINSLAGKVASGQASIYNATKFGLRGFTLALRDDMRNRGIGVSSIYPGFIRDAGMFAKSGAQLPPGVGSRTPHDVAEAVVKAIEHDIAELDVAPAGLRLGAVIGLVAPKLSVRLQHRLAGNVMRDLAEGHRIRGMR